MKAISRRLAAAAAALTLVFGFAGAARADGDAELAKVDKSLNAWKTLDFHYKVTTKDGDNNKLLKLRSRLQNKGDYNKQFIDISEPADMAGTKVLTKTPEKMYIYLPAFKKIRRIASHVNEQGFLGTALSSKDLNLTHYGHLFSASVLSENDKEVVLKLVGKGDAAPYPHIDLKIDKSKSVPVEIKYYGAEDKHLKTETRSEYVCENSYCVPRTMEMVDHTKGISSTLKLTEYKINPTLESGLFSKRNLK
jgi:outer membrane lipoprotein-sorting protein